MQLLLILCRRILVDAQLKADGAIQYIDPHFIANNIPTGYSGILTKDFTLP
jgi:hypothetical protein